MRFLHALANTDTNALSAVLIFSAVAFPSNAVVALVRLGMFGAALVPANQLAGMYALGMLSLP